MKRSPTRPAAQTQEPALVSTAAPLPGATIASGDVSSAPAVSSTEPLPSDQATALKVPVPDHTIVGEAARPEIASGRPSIVPDLVPAADLVPPVDGEAVPAGATLERVPSTVPLPADQITPVAPVGAPNGFAASVLAIDEFDFDGLRLFPVAYDVDHDGRGYRVGGVPVPLTYPEYQRLHRATAVTIAWHEGEVPRA